MYLVDTDVVSSSAPTKLIHPDLIEWMDRHGTSLFVSAVTLVEIEGGIAKSRHLGATRKAAVLAEWLETILHLYAGRVLALDLPIARLAGTLMGRASALGQAPGMPDIVIAATAKHCGLTILTRNLRHFRPLGVPAIDPFAELPDDP